jgi:hypothetical protein
MLAWTPLKKSILGDNSRRQSPYEIPLLSAFADGTLRHRLPDQVYLEVSRCNRKRLAAPEQP